MSGEEGPAVPRRQVGSSPQHLLATLLGEYFESADAALPSAAVVAILREFDVTEAGALAALSRLTRRGLIERVCVARQPVYRLTPAALARHHARMSHFLSFEARPRPWSGDWVMCSYSVPADRRAQRHGVRQVLTHLGFVLLYKGQWIRPGTPTSDVEKALGELLSVEAGDRWSVMHATFADEPGPGGPARAYDLDALRAQYEAFVRRFSPLCDRLADGAVGGAEALVARTRVMDSWRDFADTDPGLPPHLLPQPWPREEARRLFVEIHAVLGPLAQERLRALIEPYSAQAARCVTHFRYEPDDA